MNKARKRFVRYAMLCVAVLLTVLLGIINIVSFTMASEDADTLTGMLAKEQGMFSEGRPNDGIMRFHNGRPDGRWPSGTESPEIRHSLRYFTFAFREDGTVERVAWRIDAVSEEDALTWAKNLLQEQETGWTGITYRYRVYEIKDRTFVTVIDQERELLASYRILLISGIGLVLGLVLSYVALGFIGKRLFIPLEEADRKQKRFISDAEKEFKVPLTVINANTEIIERESGESEQTQSINRQVKRMLALVKKLGNFHVFDDRELNLQKFDLTQLALAAGDAAKERFEDRGCELQIIAGEPVMLEGDMEAFNDLIAELLENALKFSQSWAKLTVEKNGHIRMTLQNDTSLPSGSVDQVFDRFVKLENAKDIPGAGLGLSQVKEIVRIHNGRASAKVADGTFILQIRI